MGGEKRRHKDLLPGCVTPGPMSLGTARGRSTVVQASAIGPVPVSACRHFLPGAILLSRPLRRGSGIPAKGDGQYLLLAPSKAQPECEIRGRTPHLLLRRVGSCPGVEPRGEEAL